MQGTVHAAPKSSLWPRVAQRPRAQPHSQTFQEAPQDATAPSQLPVPCSVPAELQPQEQPRNTLQQKNPRQREARHLEHRSRAAGRHLLGTSLHSTHRTCGQPQHPPPLSHRSALVAAGVQDESPFRRAATRDACDPRCPCPAQLSRSGCRTTSSYLLLQRSSQSSPCDACPDPRDRRGRQRPATRSF